MGDAFKTCMKCGKTMKEDNFYTYKDGTKTELCKSCLTMHIDNFNPDTFLWALEKLDVPYIEQEWNTLRDKAYQKNPLGMNGMSVFGKYLSKMKLKQWRDYGWADSEKLAEQAKAKQEAFKEEQERHEKELQEKFDQGEISETEYKTLMSASTMHDNKYLENAAMRDPVTGAPLATNGQPLRPEDNFIPESELIDIGAELTHDDKIYLAMKWGRLYRPDEWIELEKNYNEMMNSFDIQDQDTKNTLILLCKTNLKMNQAIDQGDVDGALKHSRMYDSLRKSAKFTAAQNKETKADFVESVGQIVAYCEKMGGQIPRYEIKTPLDVIDKVINDLKEYNRSLIYEDKALARQIEDYLQHRMNMEKKKLDLEEAKAKGLYTVELEDEDFVEHQEMLDKWRQEDEDE